MPQPSHPLIFCLGANHKTADISVRERLHVETDHLKERLPTACHQFEILELSALATCNRFEMFGVLARTASPEHNREESDEDLVSQDPELRQRIVQAFFHLHGQSESQPAIESYGYLYFGSDAVRHLFAVTASLDSMIVGETQITGQFKKAIDIAHQAGTLGTTLSRLAQEALSATKKVRSNTSIGKKPVSISHAALDLAKNVFGDLSKRSFMLVGAGDMARIAGQHILNYQPNELMVCNRTLKNAEKLTDQLGTGQPHHVSELAACLEKTDIVISSTSSQTFVITRELIHQAQKLRRHKPLFLIDIAIPRDIDPHCADLDEVYVFDIDDLKQIVEENKQGRRDAAEQAETIIDDGALNFARWLETFAIKPVLADFRGYLDQVFRQEHDRTLGKALFADLDDRQRQALGVMLKSAIGKVMSDVSQNLKSPPDGVFADELAASLQRLFRSPKL